MIANRHAVVALLAIGVLSISSCDRNGNDTGTNNAAQTTTNESLTATNTESVSEGSRSNTTTSTGTGTGTNMDATTDKTTATGTGADKTSGSAGLAAEPPTSADARETTTGAKKTSTKKDKKKADKTGASIPPRGETEAGVASTEAGSGADESWSETSSSSSTTTTSEPGSSDLAVIGGTAGASAKREMRAQKQDQVSKFYEPQSKSPDRTGTTSMTGQDRNHAQLTMKPGQPLADPTVTGKEDNMAQTQPIQSLDLGKYSYNNRDQFKGLMETRLSMVNERIGTLRGANSERRPSNYKDVLKNIENKHETAQNQLEKIDDVESSKWESYKSSFRDQVAELERSVNTLQTSVTR